MYLYHLDPGFCRGTPLRGEVFPKADEGRGNFARRSCTQDKLVVAATKLLSTSSGVRGSAIAMYTVYVTK